MVFVLVVFVLEVFVLVFSVDVNPVDTLDAAVHHGQPQGHLNVEIDGPSPRSESNSSVQECIRRAIRR